jgi:hypothetical protein
MPETLTMPAFDLRTLADQYEETLKVRNACGNRLRAIAQGKDDPPAPEDIANSPLLDRLNDALEEARKLMEMALPEHPIYEWLMGVPGINRTIACRILGMIPMESEEDFSTFSKLRVFAGLCPGRNRLVKGQKACFSRRLKTAGYIAFTSMLKAQAICVGKPNAPQQFYADIYRKWREVYKLRNERNGKPTEDAWTPLHQNYAAKNKLLDVFFVHIWRLWREARGWSVRSLYVHEKLGHHMNYEAAEFSSPAMAEKKIKQHK